MQLEERNILGTTILSFISTASQTAIGVRMASTNPLLSKLYAAIQNLQQIALIHLWPSMLLIIHKTNQTYIARATTLRLFLLGTIKSVLKIYSNLLHDYLDFKLNIYFNTIRYTYSE
ncbi:MAG TPA: hypothetical protein DDY66_09620 [Prevotella sp.]|nr:hypothetical protein [Prevotella sp.]